MSIHIQDAAPNDDDAIRQVQLRTWVATYPNAGLGITREDIVAHFHDTSEEAIKRKQARKQAINANPLVHLWVAKDEGTIVGFCLAKRERLQNRIQAIYVLPEYQGTGIGKRLMQTAFDWLGDQQAIVLNVASYNQQAISFYTRLGFTPSGNPGHSGVTRLPSGVVIPEIEMIKRATHS